MAGLLSSLFDSSSSSDADTEGRNARVRASALDEGNDDRWAQGAQRVDPHPADDPNGGGTADANDPIGPPTGANLEPRSGETHERV